jgi:hypothetical protein
LEVINGWPLSGNYLVKNPNDPTRLIANIQGATYLDMTGDNGGRTGFTGRPWFDRRSTAVFFDATQGDTIKTISSGDQPFAGVPLTFQQASLAAINPALANNTFNTMYRRLQSMNMLWQFSLDVSASTADTANRANNSYWGESQALWVFNGTGNVGAQDAFTWTANGAGVTGATAWSPLGLTPESTGGTIANELFQQAGLVFFAPGK